MLGISLRGIPLALSCHYEALYRISNFIGSCWHEAVLFLGNGPLLLLFVYHFLSQSRETFRRASWRPSFQSSRIYFGSFRSFGNNDRRTHLSSFNSFDFCFVRPNRNGIVFSSGVNYLNSGGNIQSE